MAAAYYITCPQCGLTVQKRSRVSRRDGQPGTDPLTYCSRRCSNQRKGVNQSYLLRCEECGRVQERRTKGGVKQRFCGLRCQALGRVGRKHHNYVERVAINCDHCNKEIIRYPNNVSERNYCSLQCRNIGLPAVMSQRRGPDHPLWTGTASAYRGPNWKAQRHAALGRDSSTCQRCAAPARIVHHVKPFRLFRDYKEANDLSNLTTLCKDCHGIVEAEFWASYDGSHESLRALYPMVYCKKCGEQFDGREGVKNGGVRRVCDDCYQILVECQQCHQTYNTGHDSSKRQSTRRYCSRRCAGRARGAGHFKPRLGADNKSSKLNMASVRKWRERWKAGEVIHRLWIEAGEPVAETNFYHAIKGETWKDVANA